MAIQSRDGSSLLPFASVNKLCFLLLFSFPLLSLFMFFLSVRQTTSDDCPLVVDLNKNGYIDITGHVPTQEKMYTFFSIQTFVEFDFWNTGEPIKLDWIEGNTDGFLVDIAGWSSDIPLTGLNLMGPVALDQSFSNGFEKLSTYDTNNDGLLTAAELDSLAIWKDNGNALYDSGEIIELGAIGVVQINVSPYVVEAFGSSIQRSEITLASGETIFIEDVWFTTPDIIQPRDTQIVERLSWFFDGLTYLGI